MAKPLEQQTPEELIAYIQSLRQESKANREIAERYTQSMEGLTPAQQEGFFHIMKVYSGDKKAGAELLQSVVDSVIPQPERNQEMTQPHQPIPGFEQQPPAVPQQQEAPPAWAQALIQQNQSLVAEIENMKKAQAEQQAMAAVTQFREKATAMGYVEGTPGFNMLLQQVDSEYTKGDIGMAHEMVKAMGLAPVVEGEQTEQQAQQQQLTPHEIAMQAALGTAPAPAVAPAPAPAPAPAFPQTPGAAGSPPAGPPEQSGPDISEVNKHGRNDAALKYMQAHEAAANGGVPS